MFTYLTMTAGGRAGRSFPLAGGVENRVGRGLECEIVLGDPLCSRVHAVLVEVEGQWHLRDQSRNGTYLDGRVVEEAELDDGQVIRIGSTELAFHRAEQSPTLAAPLDLGRTQTLVRDAAVAEHDSGAMNLAALRESPEAQDLLVLHRLAVRMLDAQPAEPMLRDALELIREHAEATATAFLWADDRGMLKTKMVSPADSPIRPILNEAVSQMVVGGRRAVWIANGQARGGAGSPGHDADALYIPLAQGGATQGAIYVYLRKGHFRQSQFEFAIAVANLAARAVARARHDDVTGDSLQQASQAAGWGDVLIGDSEAIAHSRAALPKLARTSSCVLLRGERGVGKRFVGRMLHGLGRRGDRPVRDLPCAEPIETTAKGEPVYLPRESHAWQGADMGTIYLEDVARLKSDADHQLLWHLLTGAPLRFADRPTETAELDIHFLVATTVDLSRRVRSGEFPEHLYEELASTEIYLPPLRDRREDIGPLCRHFLAGFEARHPRGGLALSDAAEKRLQAYDWPGNVRELRGVLETAATVAEGDAILAEDLPLGGGIGGGATDEVAESFDSLRIVDWERRLIIAALKKSSGNVPEAAKLLGIGRATLYRKIEEHAIER